MILQTYIVSCKTLFWQVKSVGLQVLRGILLRGTHGGRSCFLIFFISEILKDVITIVQQNLVV